MVDPQNEFTATRAPTVPYDSELQVPVKHEVGETIDRDKFYWKTVGKGKFHNLVTRLCKLQSQNLFDFLLYFHLF